MGKRVVPFVALAGDALLEPFWPMGLGLKRGWQAIMDTCYALDNLYNRALLCGRLGKDLGSFGWDDHYEALHDQIVKNFEYCNRVVVSGELAKGEYAEHGPVMTQLRKLAKDAEHPYFEVEIDPWTRYAPLENEDGDKWKTAMKNDGWVHPKVQKILAMKEYYDEIAKDPKKGDGKMLISVNGKALGGKGAASFAAPPRRSLVGATGLDLPAKPTIAIPKEELEQKSKEQRDKLTSSVMASKIDAHVQRNVAAGGLLAAMKLPGTGPAPEVMNEIGHVPPANTRESVAEASEAMWNRMHEKHLSPAQEAELAHVRHMITALTKSLESYQQAETALLLAERK